MLRGLRSQETAIVLPRNRVGRRIIDVTASHRWSIERPRPRSRNDETRADNGIAGVLLAGDLRQTCGLATLSILEIGGSPRGRRHWLDTAHKRSQ